MKIAQSLHITVLSLIGLATLASSTTVAHAQYTIYDLGPGAAYGINNSGTVVGSNSAGAFIFSGGVMTYLGPGVAYGINDSGTIVGESGNQAFSYSGGVVTYLGFNGYTGSCAYGINGSGQVVGWTEDLFGDKLGFIFSGGVMTYLGPGVAYGINDSGTIVGESGNQAFSYGGGVVTYLGFNGYTGGCAYGINDAGTIVGYNTSTADAFCYSGGVMTLEGPFGSGSCAYGINDAGTIVGSWNQSPFVGLCGGMKSLGEYVSSIGIGQSVATAINNNGDIVGYGTKAGGVIEAFLLTSLPPAIISQPQSLTVNGLANATFSITATAGLQPLTFQWLFNGSNISGATSSYFLGEGYSSLTISNVGQTNLGTYAVVVSNGRSVTSSNALLSMYPYINVPFSGAITYWGHTNTFSIGAWGTGPLFYQWYRNGVTLLNATNRTLTLTSVQATNAGLYSVVVSSSLGSVTNTPAQVVVNAAGVSLGFCPALTINGVVGYSYKIQSAPNLTDTNAWVTLENLTLTQPVQIYVDTNVNASSPFSSKHYYRVLPGQ